MSEVAESPLLGSFDAGASEAPTTEAPKAEPAKADPETEVKVETPKEEPKKQDTVPLGALHEARSEIKQLRATIAELQARPSLTPEQQVALTKLQAAEKATEDAEPDFLADPKGYVDTKVAAALKKLEGTEKETQETREHLQQQQQIQAVLSATAQAEQAFTKTQPDFQQALDHVRTVRKEQLQMFYPQASEQQISQQLAQEEFMTAYQALAANRNPAEVLYGFSKTLGYKPPQPNGADKGKADTKAADKEAVRTLGSGGSADSAPEADAGNSTPEFGAALRERFKRKTG